VSTVIEAERSAGCRMKLPCFLFLMLLTAAALMAQSPIKETFAYSRETLPGIPGRTGGPGTAENPFPPTYFIYIVIKKGTPISQASVSLRGKPYAATVRKRESPVVAEHDTSVPTEKKDTLVEKTSDDVYQIEIGQPKAADCHDPEQTELGHRNEVVVSVKSGHAKWHSAAEKIVPLKPAAAM